MTAIGNLSNRVGVRFMATSGEQEKARLSRRAKRLAEAREILERYRSLGQCGQRNYFKAFLLKAGYTNEELEG